MTKNQSVRLLIVSVVGIAVLTLLGGFRSVSAGIELSQQTLAQSLDQELISVSAAASASMQALRFQMLDVMKAEMSERQGHGAETKPTRAFLNSSFAAIALLEYFDSDWNLQWLTVSPQIQSVFGSKEIRQQMREWNLQNPQSVQFYKMPDLAGTPFFAAIVPLVKGTTKMMAVGVMQPSQFMLPLSAAQSREVKVVNDKGFALALNHPAYLGTSMRRQSFVGELLGQDDLSLKKQFKDEQGARVMAAGQRLPESNLFVIVEAPLPSTLGWSLRSWLFMLLTAGAAVALTWWTLRRFFAESLLENFQLSEQLAQMRRQMVETGSSGKVVRGLPLEVDFIPSTVIKSPEDTTSARGAGPVPEPTASLPTSLPSAVATRDIWGEALAQASNEFVAQEKEGSVKLGKVIRTVVEKLERRQLDLNARVEIDGVDSLRCPGEEAQIRTALEEVLKNAFEAVTESPLKKITIHGEKCEGFNRLTIEDSGPGIPEENLKRVFEPFFSTKESGGVSRGLGLNVVRRVIEELQGRVQIFSDGTGTRVEIEIPHDVNKGLPHVPLTQEVEMGALDLDFEEIERKYSKPLPAVGVRKPKVRTLS